MSQYENERSIIWSSNGPSLFSLMPVIISAWSFSPGSWLPFTIIQGRHQLKDAHTTYQSITSCWRLTAVFTSGSLIIFGFWQSKAFDFSCSLGEDGREGWIEDPDWNSLISAICQSKLLLLSTRLNINKHNHVQMSPNEMWQFYWA